MLFSEPKIPQCSSTMSTSVLNDIAVSVLFSEPKIPQSASDARAYLVIFEFQCSSASRKFLNGGNQGYCRNAVEVSVLFSEPKIPQLSQDLRQKGGGESFSALQRAENSSIAPSPTRRVSYPPFQCSSASRKFLNLNEAPRRYEIVGFSALQRAENSSIVAQHLAALRAERVSVLFSEPKIPQLSTTTSRQARASLVSVLFSEPKIPQ